MQLSDALDAHFRLSPRQKTALKKLSITNVRDLLYHFPFRYDHAGAEASIAGVIAGTEATIFGTISKLETRKSWKRRIPVGQAEITDGTGSIKIMWFHQPYLAKKFSDGQFVKAVGMASGKTGRPYLANPHVELADPSDVGLFTKADVSSVLFPVYPESSGVTSLWFRHAIDRVLSHATLENIEDPLPEAVRDKYHLPSLSSALVWLHKPEKLSHAEAARKRFAFEEIFVLQVQRAKQRADMDAQKAFPVTEGNSLAEKFLARIPLQPTHAQNRAIHDILADFTKPHPMSRLLEGDVGSGKTLVAAATAYAIVNSRPPNRASGTLQVAYMAPTEILATQHFQSFVDYFAHLPINIALMTGSGCQKFPSKLSKDKPTDISRTQLLKWVKNGEIAMVVGTHALIQKSVEFQNLAYVIIDEQHRFGTRQRRALARKSTTLPHFLSMTATPIPRTLALTLYGDLDISILDEMPAGRPAITTKVLSKETREDAYAKMRDELRTGRQAYVICPRIDEPDPKKEGALLATSAKAEALRLKKEVFPHANIGLLHGAMKSDDKDSVMKDFAEGKIDVLVATSVVEVGINVPNATVILIEGAERFGLAQLHQLRGRVRRSSHPPFCFLLSDTKSSTSVQRLRILEKSADGFELAEADLGARGAGDLYGKKQWGVTDLGMEALKNLQLIRAAREEARNIIETDPALKNHPVLATRLQSSEELHSE